MAERGSERGPLETLTLAGLGGIALLAQRADELADELGRRFGLEREEVRTAISDVIESWRREAGRVGEGTGSTAARIVGDLGVASRIAVDELELRVAQLEHRMKLLERGPRS
jgi:polyhydroxyalkanoate synthesis regulator phasin